MKYLKTFERVKKSYKNGDYVLIDLKKLGYREKAEFEADNLFMYDEKSYNYPKEMKFAQIYIANIRKDEYRVKFYNDVVFDLYENEIIRLLKPEEIDEFEARKNALKYNI